MAEFPNVLLSELADEIAQRQLIAVVGAGVAIAATGGKREAGWQGLLESGIDYCVALHRRGRRGWDRRLRRMVKSRNLESMCDAAGEVIGALGGVSSGDYRIWLKKSVGALSPADRAVLDALVALDVPLVTTNYDSLLESVSGYKTVTWHQYALVSDLLRDRSHSKILHVHGHWEEPESVVLDTASYNRFLADEIAQGQLEAFLHTRTMLFVGFGAGLNDPTFRRLRTWMSKHLAGAGHRHYRLVRHNEIRRLQKEHLPEQRIALVSYGREHSELASFLQDLSVRARRSGLYVSSDNGSPLAKRGESRRTVPAGARPRTVRERRRTTRSGNALPQKGLCLGRTALIESLVQATLDDDSRPVAVLGGPCTGKSTIAIQALHHPLVQARFGSRRFFIHCNGVVTRAMLAAKIAQALGCKLTQSPEPAIVAELAIAPSLLVIDNAETPWRAEPECVADLLCTLSSIPGVALVTTIRGLERPFGPNWLDSIIVDPLDPKDAQALFLREAGRRHQGDPLLKILLESVGYIPFAVRLLGHLAHWEPDLKPIYTGWIRKRTALLQESELPQSQTGMLASFEVSIASVRIDEPAHRLLRLLGALPDGIAEDDLDRLFPGTGPKAASMLRRAGLALHVTPRLRIHALLRSYLLEKHAPTEADVTRAIHVYCELATSFGDQFDGPICDDAVAWFSENFANITAAVDAGLRAAEEQLRAFEAAASLAKFTYLTGAGLLDVLKLAYQVESIADDRCRARFLVSYADLQPASSRESRLLYLRARRLFQAARDRRGVAESIRKVADFHRSHGRLGRAEASYRSALSIQKTVGDQIGQAASLAGLADVAMAKGLAFEARDHFEEAFRLCSANENSAGMAYCRMRLGYLALGEDGQGDCLEACREFSEAVRHAERAHHALILASTQQGLGAAELGRDHPDLARPCFEKALPVFEALGNTVGIAGCYCGFGDIARVQGAIDEARKWYEQALEAYRKALYRRDVARLYRRLAQLEHDTLRRDELLRLAEAEAPSVASYYSI